jgi:antitoxin ParD1/3/4
MILNLPSEQEQWLRAQVDAGEFASVEEAVRQLIAERMSLEGDDFAWARALVDEARTAVQRGESHTLDDVLNEMNGLLQRVDD